MKFEYLDVIVYYYSSTKALYFVRETSLPSNGIYKQPWLGWILPTVSDSSWLPQPMYKASPFNVLPPVISFPINLPFDDETHSTFS